MGIDVYQIVTERIINRMSEGEIPWKMPYRLTGEGMAIKQNGKPYSMLNQFLLGRPGRYFTFKHATDLGFKIKKGAKSSIAVFWKLFDQNGLAKTEDGDYAIVCCGKIPYLRYYRVFHESDIEGYEPKKSEKIDLSKNDEMILSAEDIVKSYCDTPRGPKLVVEDRIPCYSPSLDYIKCPQKAQFKSISDYYKTMFHEMIHSTGHESRLKRDMSGMFGRHEYSREELVAEIGAAYLSNISDLPDKSIDNHVAYIQSWINVLRNNPKWIVWASSRAESACKFILNEKEDNEEIQNEQE